MTATMKDVRTLCPCGRWATHEVIQRRPDWQGGERNVSLGLFCERCAKQKVRLLNPGRSA